jgi:putative nucleotidyltransferase with HDIG domain
MNVHEIIDRYYPVDNELKNIYMVHACKVTELALEMAGRHPELNIDCQFVEEAAMLHDIGIFLTDAPGIQCFGTEKYICHGYLGAEGLRSLLASVDVGVVPMFDDSCVGVPYKLADYAAAGLPVASSLHGETAELLSAHNAGVAYQAGDAASFSHAVRRAALLDCSGMSLAKLFDASRLYRGYVDFVCLDAFPTADGIGEENEKSC